MLYQKHLEATLAEFFRLRPDVSQRVLSRSAGLSPGWVSEFLRSGAANLSKADAVLKAMKGMAATHPDARRLLELIDAIEDVTYDANRGEAA